MKVVLFSLLFLHYAAGAYLRWTGVNAAGGEFGQDKIPGDYGNDYIYPSTQEIDYWLNKGVNVFRLPFLWERVQPNLYAPLSIWALHYIDEFVEYVTAAGAYVILDPHNYARYDNQTVGVNISSSALADFWGKLASHYQGNGLLMYGLMNEPNHMPTEIWVEDAQEAIDAIRATGSRNAILVPGNYWTGAWSWSTLNYDGPTNAEAMLTLTDSDDNMYIEVHQYLDSSASGQTALCNSSTIGSERLTDFTNWCRDNQFKAFLTEFAGGPNQLCADAISDMLAYMEENADIWVGWTYWTAGPWWGNYYFSLEPTKNLTVDAPMLRILAPHLQQPIANQNILLACPGNSGVLSLVPMVLATLAFILVL